MAFPPTEPGLPSRLADRGDTAAWERFMAIYRPALLAIARRRGLSPGDAEDVVQEVCQSVAAAVRDFEPRVAGAGGARFSTWLATIAERKSISVLRRRFRRPRPVHGMALEDLAERTTDSRLLRLEVRRHLFHAAAGELRAETSPVTWEAFWRTAIDGEPAERVAPSLGMTAGAVYAAKARLMRKLVARIGDVEAQWSSDRAAPGPSNGGTP